ncbi:hypothetical protein G4B88_010548 [Cannabis sativa]|uniref:RNase H type-1 domain-containing protein n=1 Tax=Cannabis sativa TaxID=3483 RepID=A0A7J6G886_CANSA|nr:hypothetical protein G4B88_010548 [Cannabis sativa]
MIAQKSHKYTAKFSLRPRVFLWVAPPACSLKLNVDAATDGENSTIGLGALVRDSDGFPLGCFAKSLTGFFSPKEAEALAISYALKWFLELGFFRFFCRE